MTIKTKKNALSGLNEIIRPEQNLEKWSDFIFPHTKTKNLNAPRTKQWEVKLPDGEMGVASIIVEPSTAHDGYTSKTYDVYLALINIWELNGKPNTPFNVSMTEILKTLELAVNGKNVKSIIEEGNKLLKTNISWTLAYKINADLHTVRNQRVLDIFDYTSMHERMDKSDKFKKTCTIQFHSKILDNLLLNNTIPVNFSARKSITSPTAKVLYGKVDNILFSTKLSYSRTILNLVEDLNLSESRYKYISQRKILAEKLQSSLDGKLLSNMNRLDVSLELTTKGDDWKCIFKSVPTVQVIENTTKYKLPKVINKDPEKIDDIVYQIVDVVGNEKQNKALYKKFAKYYSFNLIARALGEFKELDHQLEISNKPAMLTTIVHRLAHEMGYEWIKDCNSKGECKFNQSSEE